MCNIKISKIWPNQPIIFTKEGFMPQFGSSVAVVGEICFNMKQLVPQFVCIKLLWNEYIPLYMDCVVLIVCTFDIFLEIKPELSLAHWLYCLSCKQKIQIQSRLRQEFLFQDYWQTLVIQLFGCQEMAVDGMRVTLFDFVWS